MTTYSAKPGEVPQNWYVVDATDQVLGRLATQIATVLRGKHKPQFTPHVDTGDFVVVVNAEKVRLTGNKMVGKKYYRHSGYLGHLRVQTAGEVLENDAERVFQQAVWGMLPKNKLSRRVISKLKVYSGDVHPHDAQQPQPFPASL